MEILATTFKTAIFEYAYQALLLVLIMSAPPIALASIIGLFVAIIQSATQIQEQTFAFAVKMVAVIGTVLFMGGWLGQLIHQFASGIFQNFYKLTM
ncbi:MAG: hypothetical protein S4CHLAM45_11400 [Chlamydiales bacterium]|nr:hypothetical protein [Chlamydiales bacterium]MCH9619632.1 hypothetical protein [Chlamydiales bacterium]MCH9623238.1 hypothetical protein [Chlamydiales bacterium]